MASLARRFNAVSNITTDGLAEDWTNVGGSGLANGVGSGSGAANYDLSSNIGDSGPSTVTKRLRFTEPDSFMPLFATVAAGGVSFAFTARYDAVLTLFDVQVAPDGSYTDHRAFNTTIGNTWESAASGTTSGLRSSAVNTLTATRTTYTHATWQASGVINYISGNTGRLNAGWTHEMGGYTDSPDAEAIRIDSVVETITYTAPAAPGSFTLSSPSASATGVSRTPTLSWNAAARAVFYRIRVSVNADMSSPIIDTTTALITLETSTADTSYAVASALAAGTTYYWRVTATNYSGPDNTGAQTTDCTADRTFTTISSNTLRRGSRKFPHFFG